MTTTTATTLLESVIAYLQEERSAYNVETYGAEEIQRMMQDALDAYQGGAR